MQSHIPDDVNLQKAVLIDPPTGRVFTNEGGIWLPWRESGPRIAEQLTLRCFSGVEYIVVCGPRTTIEATSRIRIMNEYLRRGYDPGTCERRFAGLSVVTDVSFLPTEGGLVCL